MPSSFGFRTSFWVLSLILVASGIVITLLLLRVHLGGGATICRPGAGCDVVLTSPLSTMFGFPTALYGFSFYVVTFSLLAVFPFIRPGYRRRTLEVLILLFLGGVGFSLLLTFYSMVVLEALCWLCLTSLAIVTAAFVTLSLWWWLSPSGTSSREP